MTILKIAVRTGRIQDAPVDAIAIGLLEGEEKFFGCAKEINEQINNKLLNLIKSGDFKGKQNQILLFHPENDFGIKRLILVGLGKKDDFNLESVRNASGKVALYVNELNLQNYASNIFGEGSDLLTSDLAQAQVEGTSLALYDFTRFKSNSQNSSKFHSLYIYVNDNDLVEIERIVQESEYIVNGVNFSRDLANTPGNEMTPTIFANVVEKMSKECSIKFTQLDKKKMEKIGMGAILNVSKGSNEHPRLIILEYNGKIKEPPIVLIGKGVTFDSGGISIKPSERMQEMKYSTHTKADFLAVSF